jgi:hypothetical protein
MASELKPPSSYSTIRQILDNPGVYRQTNVAGIVTSFHTPERTNGGRVRRGIGKFHTYQKFERFYTIMCTTLPKYLNADHF